MHASSNLTAESNDFRQLELPWFTTVNDFALHGKLGSGVNGLFSCSDKLQLIILHICLCFLFAPDIKIIWRIKGKDLNRNDDLKTYLVVCICVGAAALTSCQSPVCFIFPRPRTFLQDTALSFWLLLRNSRTEMPNKIGKLCFGPTPTSLFGSKQKCEVKETSLFPAKWTLVHLNTQHIWGLTHLIFYVTPAGCQWGCLWAPRTWRRASSSADIEHHSTRATFLQRSRAIPQKFYFPQPTHPQSSHVVTAIHHCGHAPSALCLLNTSRGSQLYLKETMIFLHIPTQLLSCFLERFPFCTSCRRISWSTPLTKAVWDCSAGFFQEVHWDRGMA